MSSYLYYQHDLSVLQDHQFDEICKNLLKHWGRITHRHKALVKKGDLKAGTGYAIKRYPTIIKSAALQWHKENTQNAQ